MLKLTLFVNGKMLPKTGADCGGIIGQDVRADLRDIRDRVNRILDKLDDANTNSAVSEVGDREVSALTSNVQQSMAVSNGKTGSGKEFDPLQQERKRRLGNLSLFSATRLD